MGGGSQPRKAASSRDGHVHVRTVIPLYLLVILCVHSVTGLDRTEGWIDGIQLSELLEQLVDKDGLNHADLQGVLDDHSDLFVKTKIDGNSVVQQISQKLGDRFKGAVDAVKAIKNTIETEYSSYTSSPGSYEQCCEVDDTVLERQAYLKTKVDLTKLCYRVSEDAKSDATLPLSASILTTMRNNFQQNDRLYWQYFGTEEGVFTTYPSRKADACDNYDPRFRPAYVETATPIPKDIVIVLDRSDSMSTTGIWDLAMEAATTVIGTLNPNDRMGLVYFSDDALTPVLTGDKNCMGLELSYATPQNKLDLSNYVENDISTKGGTNYIPALKAAYSLLTESVLTGDKRTRDKAILFLTDGEPSESEDSILQEIDQHAATGAIILTFGLGQDLTAGALTLLEVMSNRSVGNVSVPHPGIFTKVPDATNLRYKMGSYYNALTPQLNKDEVTITAPYVDYSGLGLITSICTPVYDTNQIKGVACIDVNMLDLIADVEFYEQGKQSYTFIIDGTGRVIIHPLLPQPTDLLYFNWDPVFIDVKTLERTNQADAIIASMKNGESDTRNNIYTTLIQSNGKSSRDGVSTESREVSYHWRQIPNTNFSVCVVVPVDEDHIDITYDPQRTKCENFISHRLDLDRGDITTCLHLSRYASKDGLGAKFTANAFNSPQDFLNTVEDRDVITSYKNYMEGGDQWGQDKFKTGVRPAVALAYQVDEHWMKPSPYRDNIVWRYVGLEAGAFLNYPAVAFDKNYDPTKRPWYRKALAHPHKVVLSAPYWDASGAGIVTTLSKTLIEGKTSHSQDDGIIGVMGMDFNLNTIQYIMNTAFSACVSSDYSCFLVDTSGYIVYHDDYVREGTRREDVEFVHITKMEPSIALDLIGEDHLVRQKCDDFEKKETYHTWKLNIDRSVIEKSTFHAELVSNTNIYVFIKQVQSSSRTCTCPDIAATIENCKFTNDDYCECPCQSSTPFQYCQNTFLTGSDSPPICVPDTSQTSFTSPIENEAALITSLEPCFVIDCQTKANFGSCEAVPACSWCDKSSGERCYTKSECPILTTASPVNNTTGGFDGGGSDVGVIVGAVIGALAFVALIIVIVVLVICLRKKYAEKESPYPGNQIQFHPNSVSELNYPQNNPPSNYNSSQGSGGSSRGGGGSFHDNGHNNYGLRLSVGDHGSRDPVSAENIYHDLDLVREARYQAYVPPVGQRLSESYVLPGDNSGGSDRPPSAHSGNETQDIYLNPRESIHAQKHTMTNQYDPRDRQYVM